MKFKKGDLVKLKIRVDGHIPKYYTDISHIPFNLIKHGSTYVDKRCNVKGAKIVEYLKDLNFYIVRYKDIYGKFVQLGFKEKDIIPLKIENWKQRIK